MESTFISKQVTWCFFMPSQPVRLYQGDGEYTFSGRILDKHAGVALPFRDLRQLTQNMYFASMAQKMRTA